MKKISRSHQSRADGVVVQDSLKQPPRPRQFDATRLSLGVASTSWPAGMKASPHRYRYSHGTRVFILNGVLVITPEMIADQR